MQNTSVENHSCQAGSAYCQIEANTVNVVLLSKQVHQLLAEICKLLLTSYQRRAWVLSWIKIKGNNQVCINFCSDPDLPLKKNCLCRVLGVAHRLFAVSCKVFHHAAWTLQLWLTGSVALQHVGILVPRPGIEPMSPALQGRFLTTGPPWESS